MSITTANMSLKKGQDADNAETYLVTDLGGSLDNIDTHEHSAGKGLPVNRLAWGLLAARPAGAQGWVYYATDTKQLFLHDGAAWQEVMPDGSITSAKIADGAISTVDIADGAITSAKIADGTIQTIDLADEAVTSVKIQNRTRTFLISPLSSVTTPEGVAFADNVDDVTAVGGFLVPLDFVSGMTVKAVWLPTGTGNLNVSNSAYLGAIGENYNVHSYTVALATVAVTANQIAALQELSLIAAAIGDYVSLKATRSSWSGGAPGANDTVNGVVYLKGWLISYTADS